MRKLKDGQYSLTAFGSILRKSSFDEIPQLFNIVIGDMSFIGPRPLLESDFEFHLDESFYFALLPGITGLAQINGRKGLNLDNKIIFNHLYKENMSFKLDLKIIYKTLTLLLIDNMTCISSYLRKF